MPKKILEDVMRPKRSSRVSPFRELSRRKSTDEEEVEIHHVELPPREKRTPRGGSSRWGWWVGGVLLVVALVYGASGYFAHAEVAVEPRIESADIAATFNASRGGKEGAIHFEVVKLSATDSVTIPATGEEQVEKKAAGTIVVYNAYSSQPQKLVANTRFKASNGKIFRVSNPVTIPGATNAGGVVTPGSLEVSVEADKAGPDYNVGLTDFTIPGFEGTPKFTKFYGRSKAPIAGGYVGTAKVANPDALKAARLDLQTRLGTKLSDEIIKTVPSGYVGYSNGFVTSFKELSAGVGSATSTDYVITGTATVQGVIIKTSELSKAIAESSVRDYTGEAVDVAGLSELGFTLLGKDTINFDTVGSIAFRLEGPGRLVWLFDEEALKKAIAGAPADEYAKIFTDFPMLRSIRPNINPPWIRSIPADISKISVVKVVE